METPQKKNLLDKLKDGIDDKEEQIQILGTFVRLGVVVWAGFIITLNYVPISWRSKKQPKTSRSSAEAETYALSDTLADARLLKWRLDDINIKTPDIITINVDNNQAKVFAENTCVNSKLRTAFSLKEHWVKELRDQSIVKVEQIPGDINIADFFTKVQPG